MRSEDRCANSASAVKDASSKDMEITWPEISNEGMLDPRRVALFAFHILLFPLLSVIFLTLSSGCLGSL